MPNPKNTRQVIIPVSEHIKLATISDMTGRTMSELLAEMIRDRVQEMQKQMQEVK